MSTAAPPNTLCDAFVMSLSTLPASVLCAPVLRLTYTHITCISISTWDGSMGAESDIHMVTRQQSS
jgi:hypothetical protein